MNKNLDKPSSETSDKASSKASSETSDKASSKASSKASDKASRKDSSKASSKVSDKDSGKAFEEWVHGCINPTHKNIDILGVDNQLPFTKELDGIIIKEDGTIIIIEAKSGSLVAIIADFPKKLKLLDFHNNSIMSTTIGELEANKVGGVHYYIGTKFEPSQLNILLKMFMGSFVKKMDFSRFILEGDKIIIPLTEDSKHLFFEFCSFFINKIESGFLKVFQMNAENEFEEITFEIISSICKLIENPPLFQIPMNEVINAIANMFIDNCTSTKEVSGFLKNSKPIKLRNLIIDKPILVKVILSIIEESPHNYFVVEDFFILDKEKLEKNNQKLNPSHLGVLYSELREYQHKVNLRIPKELRDYILSHNFEIPAHTWNAFCSEQGL